MKLYLLIVCAAIFATFGLTEEVIAKPDKVDGMNVPEGRIPQVIVDNRYPRTYYPGTEKLASDEMRITALGTGMPNQSPSNVAASFLVELGNGDAFLFDSKDDAKEAVVRLYKELNNIPEDRETKIDGFDVSLTFAHDGGDLATGNHNIHVVENDPRPAPE